MALGRRKRSRASGVIVTLIEMALAFAGVVSCVALGLGFPVLVLAILGVVVGVGVRRRRST